MRKILSIFLALLIFFTTAGVNIYKHTCLDGNKTEYALSNSDCCEQEPESCCEGETAEDEACGLISASDYEDSCCNTELTSLKLDADKYLNNFILDLTPCLTVAYEVLPAETPEEPCFADSGTCFRGNLPPPVSGLIDYIINSSDNKGDYGFSA